VREEGLQLGGPRMDALVERFAANFRAAERTKLLAIAADDDVSPLEMLGLMIRANAAGLASTIKLVAEQTGLPIDTARDFAIEAMDHLLLPEPEGAA